MKIARVLCHPHVPVGDRAPTLWLAEEAIFEVMTSLGAVHEPPLNLSRAVQPIIEAKTGFVQTLISGIKAHVTNITL